MNRSGYLVKNTTILLISNFASKILTVILLPLYTSVLTPGEYAVGDLIASTVSVLVLLLTLCVPEGIMRFALSDEQDKSALLNSGLLFSCGSTLIVAAVAVLLGHFGVLGQYKQFTGFVIALYFFTCMNQTLIAFAKGQEQIRLIGICGVLSSAGLLCTNIVGLLLLHMRTEGYLMSLVAAQAIPVFVCFFAGGAWRFVGKGRVSKKLIVKLLKYSAPLMMTQICWMVDTSADKYIVAGILGTSAAGLLAMAHKIPSMLTTFTSVFIQAWKLSVIKEYRNKDSEEFFSKMFNLYNTAVILFGSLIILISQYVGIILFKNEFGTAWVYAPVYILGFVINSISAFAGAFYTAGKETSKLFSSTLIGSAVNVVTDIVLVHYIGLFGAGIATCAGYIVTAYMRIYGLRGMVRLKIEYKRMLTSYALIIGITYAISTNCIQGKAVAYALFLIMLFANRIYVATLAKKGAQTVKKFLKSKGV